MDEKATELVDANRQTVLTDVAVGGAAGTAGASSLATSAQTSLAILGAGSIGANAARHLIAAGYNVAIINSGDAVALKPLQRELGAQLQTPPLAEAVASADVVLLAVPWTARHPAIRTAAGSKAFAGKIVIDAMNPYGASFRVERLDRTLSETVADEVGAEAKVMKAFNTLAAQHLAEDARPPGSVDRIVIPISGDDPTAKVRGATIIDGIGFDALDAGTLAESGAQEPKGALYGTHSVLAELSKLVGGR